jgi:hypothetical protein
VQFVFLWICLQKTNKFVSTSTLSREDKAFVQDLTVKLRTVSLHGNSKATCWKYVGQLFHSSENVLVDESRLYCSVCLETEKTKSGGHISKVASFCLTTSTANMNLHLSTKHNINENVDVKVRKVLDYFNKYDACMSSTMTSATTKHEFNRDMVLWFCRDLTPFHCTEKPGMIAFFQKNLPGFDMPSQATLSSTALNDVYIAAFTKVKEALVDIRSVRLMFDGWTDKHRARPYLGLRASFIRNWKYEIVTLSCEVLPSHTGIATAEHALKTLRQFIPDVKKIMLSSCHDGAANMIKASQHLKVTHYQHCSAHALHLLLTVDSVNQLTDIVNLLQKCRDIISNLHFKSTLLDDESASLHDKELIEKLKTNMAETEEIMHFDDRFQLNAETDDSSQNPSGNSEDSKHKHITLKTACPTRWNSTLRMI